MPRNGLRAALAVLFVIGAGLAAAAPPHLVKDVDDATLGQLDRILLETGGLVYFTANGYVHRSDGTASGTFPIAPSGGFGPSSASALGGALIACGREGLIRSDGSVSGTQLLRRFSFVADDRLARLGTHVYFDGSRYGSTELWRTDGTAAGTRLFKTFAAGPNDKIQGLVATSDRLYFTLGSPRKLFVSDGTPAGTTFLGDYAVDGAVAVGGRLFFFAWQAGGSQKLFVTDGTAAGTVPLFTLAASSVKPGLTALADRVVFRNVVSGVGVAPWVSDGSVAGTGMLRSMDMESFGEEPFEVAGGAAYFLAQGDLWRTEGTPAGTSLVKAGLHISDVISSGSRLLLDVFHSSLWVSDGTPQGTLLLGSFPAFLRCPDAVELGGRLFFGFDHTRYGTELWATDGTPSGTGLVVDLDRRTLGFGPSLVVAGSTRAYLSYGIFYTTDGTEGGTHPLTQGGVLLRGSNPSFAVQGDTGYLCGDKLWRTDGTDAGTITLSPAGHSCEWVVRIGEQIHFLTRNPMNQSVFLWRSDGSPQGTALVRDLGNSFGAYGPAALAGGIVFVGNRYPEGPELWISDGTSGGTHLIADVAPGVEAGITSVPVAAGSIALFRGPAPEFALWRTDGTAAGTVPVPGGPARVEMLAGSSNGEVYFLDQPVLPEPVALWKSDGTSVGTKVVKRFSGPFPFNVRDPVLSDGKVFFTAYQYGTKVALWAIDGASREELLLEAVAVANVTAVPGGVAFSASGESSNAGEPWFSDGTRMGTRMLGDVAPGPQGSSPDHFARVGSMLLFSATEPIHGRELWRADLSGDGEMFYTLEPCRVADTRIVEDGPPVQSSFPRDFQLTGRCGIPDGATGVSLNVTVTGSTGAGWVEVHPEGRESSGARSTSFGRGSTRASWLLLGLDPASHGRATVRLFGAGSADVILDVSGYFR